MGSTLTLALVLALAHKEALVLALPHDEARALAVPVAEGGCVGLLELLVLGVGSSERVGGAVGDRESEGEEEGVQVEGSARPGVRQPPQGQGVGAALPAGQKLPTGQGVAFTEKEGQKEPGGHSKGPPEEQ